MKLAKSILATQHSNNPVGKRFVRRAFRTPEGRVFYQKILFSAIACLMPGAVFAAPQSGQVVAGVSTISTPDANTTVITQSTDKSIINWQSFSIGADEYVQFVQPDTHSVSLNQVIGGNPSSILGSLSANGQVYLVNPNGIYFGQGVQVDVSGITASVLGIDNNDFMNGEYVFTKDTNVPFATVVNEGVITARNNGYVVLLGDYTQNTGVIQAQMGKVVLASGSRVTMDISGNNLVSVVVNEAAVSELAGVENSGEIYADGGRVIMTAKVAANLVSSAVNSTGLIQANSIVEHDGAIFLTASGGDITNSGTLDASAQTGSNVDGGGVLVYSDKNITLSSGAEVKANGDGSGSGGVVRVIAEDRFDFQSSSKISVEGGDQKGGFIEISGHGGLSVQGDVELGAGGSLLVDPVSLNISTGSAGPSSNSESNAIGSGFVEGVLNAGANVSLIASSSITASSGADITATGEGILSIQIGTVSGTGGTLGGLGGESGSTGQCNSLGFCAAGNGTSLFTPGANGSINLANVTFNLAAGLNVAGGTASGSVDLGAINGGGVSITAADNIGINDLVSTGNVSITAGNNVNIIGATNEAITVEASGDLDINATVLQVSGAIFSGGGESGGTGAGMLTPVTLEAHNDLNISVGLLIASGGRVNLREQEVSGGRDVSVLLHARNNVNISAAGINVRGGSSVSAVTRGFTNNVTVTAQGNATISADNNVNISVTGNLNVAGGDNVDATDSNLNANNVVEAQANAAIIAGNNVNITNVGGTLSVAAGDASASATNSSNANNGMATASANASISANSNVTVSSAGVLDITRGKATANINGGGSSYGFATGATVFANANASIISLVGDVSLTVTNDISMTGVFSESSANTAAANITNFSDGIYSLTANANTLIKGSSNVTVNTGGNLNVLGGVATTNAPPGAGTHTIVSQVNATAMIESVGGTVAVNATGLNSVVTVGYLGGTNNAGSAMANLTGANCNSCAVSANATATVTGPTVNITIPNGNLDVLGGKLATATVDVSENANAVAMAGAVLEATQNLSVNAGGVVMVAGGIAVASGGGMFGGTAMNNSSSATANAAIKSGVNLSINAGTAINVTGGTATASPGTSPVTRIAQAEAVASVTAVGAANMTVSAGNVDIVKGMEVIPTPATAPDITTADASAMVSAGTLSVNASANIRTTLATLTVTGDASFVGGTTVLLDAASQMSFGGDLSITGGVLDANNANYVTLGGSNLLLAASTGDLDLTHNIGTSGALFNANLMLSAGGDVNIDQNIFLSNRSLSLKADSDTSGVGDVVVGAVTVNTLGDLAISGANINDSSANISANNLTANATGNIAITNTVTTITNAANYTAGGNIIQSGGSVNAGGNIAYSAANINAMNTNIVSGAGLSVMAAGNILAAAANLTGAGMYISAGNNQNLTTSTLNIGAGIVSGVLGDVELLSSLRAADVPLPAFTYPTGKFVAGGMLDMGGIALSGSDSYLWFNADSLTMGTVTAPTGSKLLVQYSPFTTTNTIGLEDQPFSGRDTFTTANKIGLENQRHNGQGTHYSNAEHIFGIPATTIAIGSSQQTGDIIIGTNGPLNVGSKNFIFVSPTGNITGEGNIITTGIVASNGIVAVLGPTISITPFIPPLLEDIDVDNDESLLAKDDDDDENKDEEEGEDVDDDKLVDDKTDESGMCTAV